MFHSNSWKPSEELGRKNDYYCDPKTLMCDVGWPKPSSQLSVTQSDCSLQNIYSNISHLLPSNFLLVISTEWNSNRRDKIRKFLVLSIKNRSKKKKMKRKPGEQTDEIQQKYVSIYMTISILLRWITAQSNFEVVFCEARLKNNAQFLCILPSVLFHLGFWN